MTTNKGSLTIKEIREKLAAPKVVDLPSGISVTIQRLTPMDYIREGLTEIPNEFYQFISDLQKGKLDFADDQKNADKNLALFEKFLVITIEKGVVNPPMLFKWQAGKEDSHLLFMELSKLDQATLIDSITGK